MAAGPAGKVVGKAVVKVVPDTSDAYDEVQNLVKRLERDGVSIKVTVDTQGAKRDVDGLVGDTARRKVSVDVGANTDSAVRQAKASVATIGKLDAKVEVELDERRFSAERASIASQLEQLRGTKVDPQVDLDIAAAEAKRAELEARLEELSGKTSTPKIEAETAKAQADIGRIDAQIAALAAKRADPKVDVDIANLEGKLARVDAALGDLQRRKVDLDLGGDGGGGGIAAMVAVLAAAGDQAGDALGAVGDALGSIKDTLGAAGEQLGKLGESAAGALGKAREEVDKIAQSAAGIDVEADTGNAAAQAAELAAFIDSLEPTIGVDLDTGLATAQATAVRVFIGSLKPTMGVDADTSEVVAKASALKALLEALDPTVKVDADTGPAGTKALDMSGYIRSLDPQMRVGADTGPAGTKALDMERFIAGLDPEIRVGADTTPAKTKALAMTAYINSLDAKIRVTADVDKPGVAGIGDGIDQRGGGKFAALASGLSAVFTAGSKLPSLLGGISGALGSSIESGTKASGMFTELGTSVFGAGSKMAGAAGPIGAAVGVVGSLISALVGFGVQVATIAVIAGAVTFAVGALGSAFSALPALLFGAGLAAGSVFLGLDGIKKAAGAAKPALDGLKASISGVFEKGLTPFFQQVNTQLPKLDAGFRLVAASVTGLLNSLLSVAFGTEGIRNLQLALQNTSVFVDSLTPGVTLLVGELLKVATVEGPFRILGELVSGLSIIFAGLFARFAEGGESSLMVRSFDQLRNVVLAAAGVLGELVLGATEFFTAAGPGVTSALEAIGRVIQKIDFKSLGESFGSFVDTAARFIDSIPQSTWDGIAAAVALLAKEFKKLADNPNVQKFFNTLLLVIPGAVVAFAGFVAAVSASATIVATVFDAIGAAATAGFGLVQTAALTIGSVVLGAMSGIVDAVATVVDYLPFFPDSWKTNLDGASAVLDSWKGQLDGKLQGATDTVTAKGGAAAAAGGAFGKGIADGAAAGVAPMPGAMGQAATLGVGGVNGKVGAGGAAGTALGAGTAGGAKAGIAPMPGTMGTAATGGVDGVNGKVGAAGTAGTALGSGAAGGAKTGITPMPGDMTKIVEDARRGIQDKEPGFADVGRAIIEGLAKALRGGASSVIEAAVGIATSAIRAAKNALGIASPSKVFRYQIGAMIPAGWSRGIADGAPQIERAIGSLADSTTRLASGVTVRPFYRAGVSYGEQIADGVTTGVRAVDPTALLTGRAELAAQVARSAVTGTVPAPRAATGGPGGGRNFTDDDLRALAQHQAEALEGARLQMHPDNAVTIARQNRRGERTLSRR